MQKVLTDDLWPTVRKYAKVASQRKAAIAYVTQDLIRFRKGDVLIVDASHLAISSGGTAAHLLRTLYRKQVNLYDCADLHAKVLLLSDVAVISSANMSNSSKDTLVEVGVVTDHATTVSEVESLIEQLVQHAIKLDAKAIDQLCKIKVIRRGGRGAAKRRKGKVKISPFRGRTWIVGVRELVHEPKPAEQRLIDKAQKKLQKRFKQPDEEYDWIIWRGKSKFRSECRPGDSIIKIWRERNAKLPRVVYRRTPVLLKQESKNWTRFYLPERDEAVDTLPYKNFCHLMKSLKYPRRIGPTIQQVLDSDKADEVTKEWAKIANKHKA